jgi:hypothetical protein
MFIKVHQREFTVKKGREKWVIIEDKKKRSDI